MTNATIDTISGNEFTVTFRGGGARVKLAPDARVIKRVAGSTADLKPGASVLALVANGVAQTVSLQ